MTGERSLRDKAVELMARLERDAGYGGYHLNPDTEMTLILCEGLVQNLERFGYRGCPCRLMEGERIKDLDLVCPCDYRDPDLFDHGACYCALYVSREVLEGKKPAGSIPERRLPEPERRELAKKRRKNPLQAGIKLWRCKVCGYLCAREFPPECCPVCRVSRDRFEAFTPPPAKTDSRPKRESDFGEGGPG